MTERRSLPHRLVLLLLPTLGLAACATSSMNPSAPPAAAGQVTATPATAMDAERESQGMDGQMAALTKAEADLNQALGRGKMVADKPPVVAGKPSGGTGATPMKSPQPAPGAAGLKGEEGVPSGDPCATACTALASMERATTHLCGLAGEGDHRCEDARTRVRSATERVRASCPACAAN